MTPGQETFYAVLGSARGGFAPRVSESPLMAASSMLEFAERSGAIPIEESTRGWGWLQYEALFNARKSSRFELGRAPFSICDWEDLPE